MDSKKPLGYRQIESESLTRLYEKNKIGLGNIYGRIEFMLKYLNHELNNLPVFEWAEALSFGVHGNYKGLNMLEQRAVEKLELCHDKTF